ncbi:MAG: PDGLE domain-containing protein [Candidatus Omnitrophica bacterium]|nr:PDGLE domain-containing protein [Candidatus Omnitrophota bacterium]
MSRNEIIVGLFIAVILAVVFSPFASPWPDGLEKVAEDKGFLQKGEVQPLVSSPVPDYAWPGIENEGIATSLAGISGTLVTFGLGLGLAALLRRKNT